MRSSSRVLIGFGIALAVLVVVTIVLVFTLGQKNIPLLDESTPEGTVQRYLLAIQDQEYSKAYSYLSIPPSPSPNGAPKPVYPATSYDFWLMSAQNAAKNTWKANLETTVVSGNTATVSLTVEVFRTRGLFENPVSTNTVTFSLQKEGTGWSITSPIDVYWVY
jgi:hypothetical protein